LPIVSSCTLLYQSVNFNVANRSPLNMTILVIYLS
jgi:hypothetical protein